MGSEHYCLRWNNHQSNLLGVFSQLLRDESLVDVTLACSEGHSIRAHKVVLSACSSYFQTLFVDHPSRHPILILKDVRFSELRTLIEFMYKGEVNIEYCQLSALLKTAESLKVKGLAEMTRNYQPKPDEEESREQIIAARSISQPPRPSLSCDNEPIENSPTSIQNLVTCKSPAEDREVDGDKEATGSLSIKNICLEKPLLSNHSDIDDISVHNSNNAVVTSPINPPIICSRLTPPACNDTIAGPSNMPPVQQVPLSLKKEADWAGGQDDKNLGEISSEYSRHLHDSEMESSTREDSPHNYTCMYCGNSFPHQSKLTRHILSHSLETLKYREQRHHHVASLSMSESLSFVEFSGRIPATSHDPPDPTDQPPTPMDFDLTESPNVAPAGSSSGGVVLCKFCGKSFPDVSSLISHLPMHTGDRPFKCEFCGKAFKLRHHMKDHCRVHTGERPFRCSLCGKTFSRSTILKAHEKTHYPKYVRKFLSPNPLDTEEENPH